MSAQGDQLIARLQEGENGILANQLLNEFFSGYSVENLRPLLASSDEAIAKTGVWLASELGERASPIFDAVVPMLHHASRYVRFFAIDVVLVCAKEKDGAATASTIGLLLDNDEAVRWKSLMFAAKASTEQLSASLPYQRDSDLKTLTSWIIPLNTDSDAVTRDIAAKLDDDRRVVRLFAAAAAARISSVSSMMLELAAESADKEVASFASKQLRLLRWSRSGD